MVFVVFCYCRKVCGEILQALEVGVIHTGAFDADEMALNDPS